MLAGGVEAEEVEPNGVYALVKDFMSSPDLMQAPALVLPAGRVLANMLPTEPAPRVPLTEKKIKDYTKLALECVAYQMPNAKQAVEDLLFDAAYVLPMLEWLVAANVKFRWRNFQQIVDVNPNPFFPHLPNSLILISKDRR